MYDRCEMVVSMGMIKMVEKELLQLSFFVSGRQQVNKGSLDEKEYKKQKIRFGNDQRNTRKLF